MDCRIVPINSDYRFRELVVGLETRGLSIMAWNLEKRGAEKGEEIWRFVANDRSPGRLGLYCERLGIMPDADNAELLSTLAHE